MPRPLHVVILAGGEGSRMKALGVPKVLVDVLGRTVIGHVVAAASTLRPAGICVVAGDQLTAVKRALESTTGLSFARQARPLGTGDAARKALRHLPRTGVDVLILYGDMPLIRGASLRELVTRHRRRRSRLTIVSAIVDEPDGLGRIVRDERGVFLRIVEHADATADERAINEINAGGFLVGVETLREFLPRLKRGNAQGEYYLTDLVEHVRERGAAWALPDAKEALGINRPEELLEVKSRMRRRILAEHAARGVVIEDPDQTLIECDVRIARGSVVAPFCVIRRGVSIAARCRIGPFAHLRGGTKLAAGTTGCSLVEIPASEPVSSSARPSGAGGR